MFQLETDLKPLEKVLMKRPHPHKAPALINGTIIGQNKAPYYPGSCNNL